MVYIYNNNLEILDTLNYTLEEFNVSPISCYPTWNETMIASEIKFNKPILDNGTLREMTREEICENGDLSILLEGEYFENGKIVKVEYNEELGYLKPIWNSDLHQWLDGATDLEQVQSQIQEYSKLDTPSTLKEMGSELADECMDMLIQLRGMAYKLENTTEVDGIIEDRDMLVLPKPSKELKAFKDRFNSIK